MWDGIGTICWPHFREFKAGNMAWVDGVLDYHAERGLAYLDVASMMWGGLGQMDPREPGHLEALDRYLAYVAQWRIRSMVTALLDVNRLPSPPPFDAMGYAAAVADVCARHELAIFREANENAYNGVTSDSTQLPRPAGIPCSPGSGGADEAPPFPTWDIVDSEPGRNDEWPRKSKMIWDLRSGNNTPQKKFEGVAWLKEPIGTDEVAEDGRTTNNAQDTFDDVACARLFGAAGYTLYPRAYNRLEQLGPKTDACVRAALDAQKVMPIEYALGSYSRDSGTLFKADLSQVLRFYQMKIDGRGVAVAIRPTETFKPTPKPGVTVRETRGQPGRRETIWLFDA